MTQVEKQLLLKDLCARLPYGALVFIRKPFGCIMSETKEEELAATTLQEFIENDDMHVFPYLRPMTSMTEKEKKELKAATCPEGTGYFDEQYLICPMSHFGEYIGYDFMSDILDWLNAHHFDVRGLIEKGLAIDCTNLNIY